MSAKGRDRTAADRSAGRDPEQGPRSPAVVGIGASAGGLEAFSRLLQHLPADTGMAFVLVQHLDPQHPSLLSHLLAGRTAMPVAEATDRVEVAADHVYVVPPGDDLVIEKGLLRLRPRDPSVQPHLPVDTFLRSLAEDKGERALAVILSGAASDGAQGMAAVKSEGGMTFAQDPSTAEYASMPLSAIGARVVDFVLPPEEIAEELARLGAELAPGVPHERRPFEGDGEPASLEEVFALLHGAFRVDFSAYKLPTIRRRIARRMLVRRTDDLGEYLGLLRDEPVEVEALYRDILIMVTEFFREPETFAVLRDLVIPAILRGKRDGSDVRIWVPGCASGEEAYSLAITLLDAMVAHGVEAPVKIFATDISEPDLTAARRGLYPGSVSTTIASDQLRRYFTATEGGYQISKSVRELCVFARHDVTSDPPFPNLDLVSCRNLLIYLSPGLQRWVIPSLHYGLRRDGYLVLGRSESIGPFTELFETVDKKQKIFRKLSPASTSGLFRLRAAPHVAAARGPALATAGGPASLAAGPAETREADQAVLAGFAPPGVTIDAQRTIVEFRGDTSAYLRIPPGRPSLNLLDMVRRELRGKVRAVIAEAERSGATEVFRAIPLGRGKARRTVDLHAIPFLTKAGETHFVVLFDEPATAADGGRRPTGLPESAAETTEADRLRDELNETRERLEAVIQDQEAANEELRAANEELLSSGEEMQSINEELETTQEELQSTNQELRARNLEVGQVSDDLSNLLTSVSFPIIMVGRDFRIRRFTPAAARLLKVIPSDVGRLLTDLRLRIDVPDLEQILGEVIETMAPEEREVRDDEGRWYAMQVRPYKTLDNRIDGAVITLFDIDEMKRLLAARKAAEDALRESEARLTLATAAAALGVHDYDVTTGTIGWDARVREIWGIGPDEQVEYDTFMRGVHPADKAAAQAAVDEAMTPGGDGRYRATFRVLNAADGSVHWVAATGQVLFAGDTPIRLVGTVEDITARHDLEQAVRAIELATAGQDERRRLARELHDSTTQALFAATLKAEALSAVGGLQPGPATETLEELRRLSRGALAQMRTLLLELHDEPLEQVPIGHLLQQLVEAMEGRVATICRLETRGDAALTPVLHRTVYRIVQEALNNVTQHARAKHAWVLFETYPDRMHLSVEDDGQGFDPAGVDPSHLGLRSMRERAAEAGADFAVGPRSEGGTVVALDWSGGS